MPNMVVLAYVAADLLFLATGGLLLGYSIIIQNNDSIPPSDGRDAVVKLLWQKFPIQAAIVNAGMIFVTFLVTLPGVVTPTRSWIKMGIWMTTLCGFLSLAIGLYLWIMTLTIRVDFLSIWESQTYQTQALMQATFNCCGYFNSTLPPFVTDSICPSPAAAALMRGCVSPLTSFANIFLDEIFTSVFGMVTLDGLFVLAAACLLKERKERERFRHIDEKSGSASF